MPRRCRAAVRQHTDSGCLSEKVSEKSGQELDLVTAATVHGYIMCSKLQQLSRPASPTNSVVIEKLWQG